MPLPLNLCDDHHPAIAFLGDCPICSIGKHVELEEWQLDRREGEGDEPLTLEALLEGWPRGVARTVLKSDLALAIEECQVVPR